MSKAEKFILDNTIDNDGSSDIINWYYKRFITPDAARKAVEIAREEIYEWLLANADDYCFGARNFETRRCIYDLKKYLEDKK